VKSIILLKFKESLINKIITTTESVFIESIMIMKFSIECK